MEKIIVTGEDIIAIINVNTKRKMSCGCMGTLHVLMATVGYQFENGQDIKCPVHNCHHEWSNDEEVKIYCAQYFKHIMSDKTSPLTTMYPPNSL